jgi:hypothetical protein
VSNLYEAGSGTRLWTIQSTCFDKAHLDSVMRDEARAIVRQLRPGRPDTLTTAGSVQAPL